MALKIVRAVIQNGSTSVSGYQKDGAFINSAPIDGYVMFSGKNIGVQERTFDLNNLEMGLEPISLWVKFTNAAGTITLNVKDAQSNPVVTTFSLSITSGSIPFTFPFVIIRPEQNIVTIQSSQSIDEIRVYCRPVDLLEIRSL